MEPGKFYYKVSNVNHFQIDFDLQYIIERMPHFKVGIGFRVSYKVEGGGSFTAFENKYSVNFHSGILKKISYQEYLDCVHPDDMSDYDKEMLKKNKKPSFEEGDIVEFTSPFSERHYKREIESRSWDSGRKEWFYHFELPEGKLKLIESTLSKPKCNYKKGDKVIIPKSEKFVYGGELLNDAHGTIKYEPRWCSRYKHFFLEVSTENNGHWKVSEDEIIKYKDQKEDAVKSEEMFKKGDYIVVLDISEKNSCGKNNYVFKQREYCDYIRPYVDLNGSITNGHSYNDFKCKKSLKKWRYATKNEIKTYDFIGKPFDVTKLPTKKGQRVKVVRKDEKGMHWNESFMFVGLTGEISSISKNHADVIHDETNQSWTYNISCLEVINEETNEISESKFKPGDIITAKKNTSYVLTNYGTKCIVIGSKEEDAVGNNLEVRLDSDYTAYSVVEDDFMLYSEYEDNLGKTHSSIYEPIKPIGASPPEVKKRRRIEIKQIKVKSR